MSQKFLTAVSQLLSAVCLGSTAKIVVDCSFSSACFTFSHTGKRKAQGHDDEFMNMRP